ncbi:hypothetical protein DH2020_011361 [Rehmannia glutinosa]|uniref:Zinc finger PHD-type domain-containing protein n=1 Tax=Rehmannia glutinosa TaxID=99300 RepID=A0ABR0XD52_REHGL
MDWLEKNLCIKCDEGGNLLVCSENGCPLAIHEGCMSCPAIFDDAGHFYCPYCLYKQAYAESRQAREYALARKKALLTFMDEEMIDREKDLEEDNRAQANENNQSKVSEANVNITCGDGNKKDEASRTLKQPQQPSVKLWVLNIVSDVWTLKYPGFFCIVIGLKFLVGLLTHMAVGNERDYCGRRKKWRRSGPRSMEDIPKGSAD